MEKGSIVAYSVCFSLVLVFLFGVVKALLSARWFIDGKPFVDNVRAR